MMDEQHSQHKLTAEQVLYVRQRYASGSVSKAALAREMGISKEQMGRIINRQSWRHLIEPNE